METVVRYTKFSSNPHGDGGSRRSVQIAEYWQDKSAQFIDEKFELPKQYTFCQAFRWIFRAIHFITCHIGWGTYPSIEDKYKAVLAYALRIPIIYDKYKGQEVTFIWENTNDIYALYIMKAAGAKIIGCPHNIESLVPTQIDPITHKEAPYWLYEEVERLKQCDEVWTISKDDTRILQLFGINASYFPYYPPKSVEQELIKIKNHRNQKSKNTIKRYLVLGSATNPPTRMGMQMLIDFFAKHKDRNFDVHIAGYQTEVLQLPVDSNLIIHGTVSFEQLQGLMIETDGIIIYQPATSGVLTRILECHLAGIPVHVNFNAARDYYNLPDVHVYENMEQLQSMLNIEQCS